MKPVSKMKRGELEKELRDHGIDQTRLERCDLPYLRTWVRAKRKDPS